MIERNRATNMTDKVLDDRAKAKAKAKKDTVADIEAKVDAAILKASEAGESEVTVTWDAELADLVEEVAAKFREEGYLVGTENYYPDDGEDERISMEVVW